MILPAVSYRFLPRVAPRLPWHVRQIDITEELAGAFVAVVDLENDDPTVDPEALFNDAATLILERLGGGFTPITRRFTGVIRRLEEVAHADQHQRRFCRVVIEPAFACLKNEITTTKYQDMSIPDVLRQLLGEARPPFARPFDLKLWRLKEKPDSWRRYGIRDLCVQYGESTYDFARRIMAEEGISYYFDFEGDSDKLVLVDENLGFPDMPSAPIAYLPVDGAARSSETISEFVQSRAMTAGKVSLKTFDHTRHKELRAVRAREPESSAAADGLALEVHDGRPNVTLYDYGDDQYRKSDIDFQAVLRLEQEEVRSTSGRGRGDVIGFSAGHQFTLLAGDFGGSHVDGKYLLTSVRHRGHAAERFSVAGSGQPAGYGNEFTCIPSSTPFRLQPITKPTAIEDYGVVVAASPNDPIWTDKHGRVRVRFLQMDGQDELPPGLCSPWIPVSQLMAGAGFGVQLIPRAGMVVRIRYQHGDPDRPYVAGCLPTVQQALPSRPPAEKTRSTWRSRSLRDGGNDLDHYNEITMEDAANAEELFIRAGRNLRRRVLNDNHTTIDGNEVRVVGRNQTIEIGGHRKKHVQGDETLVVEHGRSTTITGSDTRTVHGNDKQTIDRDQSLDVRGSRTTNIHQLEKATFHAGRDQEVTGDDVLHVSQTHAVTADVEWKAMQGPTTFSLKDGNARLSAGGDISFAVKGALLKIDADGHATLQSEHRIELACGNSSIVLTPDKIEIASPEVSVTGSGGAITLDDTGAATTGINITSTALGTNELTGTLVKAN